MSYIPTNWQTGDTITAEKLNNMESGIDANAGYWIPVEQSSGVLSVPANKVEEVLNALYNPERVFVRGVCLNGQAYYPGYCVTDGAYECRITKETMVEIGYSSAGKIMVVDDGNLSVSVVPDIFIVTLTPTAQDFSGTMDKTVGEINAAYEAGQKIQFHLIVGVNEFYDIDVIRVYTSSEGYRYFHAELIAIDRNLLIDGYTGGSDPTSTTYSTTIYPLTPMS